MKIFINGFVFFYIVEQKGYVKNFCYKDLSISLHLEVYEPAEDTYLLLDCLDVKPRFRVLEIGTGCGIIALDCCRNGADVICTDVNPYAIENTLTNFLKNKKKLTGGLELRQGNLFNICKADESFDIVVFNPPYLPTVHDELVHGSGWFDRAVDGGVDGLKHTVKFIEHVGDFLNDDGVCYFVFSSLSPRARLENVLKKNGFSFKVVKSAVFGDEKLDVYMIKK